MRKTMPWVLAVAAAGLAGTPGPGVAAGPSDTTTAPVAAPAPEPELPEPAVAALEATLQGARSTAEWLASGVDSWFGDRPFSEGGQVRDGHLSLGLFKRGGDSVDVNFRFNARFRLPNLEERYYVFIGRDNPRDLVTDQPGALTREEGSPLDQADQERSFFAGLGVLLLDAVDARVGFRGGLKPYVQLRYRRPWVWADAHRLEFRQTAFWSVDDHLGSTTVMSYEWRQRPDVVLRGVSSATYTQSEARWEVSSNVGRYQSFGRQRLLSLELLSKWKQHTGVWPNDAGVQLKWEQPLHHDWVLGELKVGHYWPREDASEPRQSVWGLGGTLKLRF